MSPPTPSEPEPVRALSFRARPPLARAFYARPVLTVARECIGKTVVRTTKAGMTAGRIVEAEAYRGPADLAAHSSGGRRTPRTEVMFGAAGHAYVFLIYGLHSHFNLVAGLVGEPHAVLIRAVEPLEGVALIAARRGMPPNDAALTNGPGKLCVALAITRADYGVDLCRPGALFLAEGRAPKKVSRSPRIGVDYAGQWALRPWRFFDAESRYVSKVRKEARAS